MSKKICLYLHVHQPHRIKNYQIFDIGNNSNYFDLKKQNNINKQVFDKVSKKSYIPMNNLLYKLLVTNKKFKINFSITGTLIEQANLYNKNVLQSFIKLSNTKKVEILGETYYHSLASLYSETEFKKQVKKHTKTIKKYFNMSPQFFRNTELIYSNHIAQMAEDLKFKGIITEGTPKILGWRSPNYLYKTNTRKSINLLLKNYVLSDDVAWRFSNKHWVEHPLSADKYMHWLDNTPGDVINLFMDYETFGEHQWEDTNIFQFFEDFVKKALNLGYEFIKVSESSKALDSKDRIDCPFTISWADEQRDTSAWTENSMQQDSLRKIYTLEKDIMKSKSKLLKNRWRRLQTSDHFYYMCTKWFNDGDAHKYFSPYSTPYEAFNNFNNALIDLKLSLKEVLLNGNLCKQR